MLAVGAGERAALVAEQFGLDQVLGNRAAVDRDEPAPRARAAFVNRAGNELLAATRLTGDENRRLGRRHFFDHSVDVLHDSRAAIKSAEPSKCRCGRGTRRGHERQRYDDVVGRCIGQHFIERH